MKAHALSLLLCLCSLSLSAQTLRYVTDTDIPYTATDDEYRSRRCLLDIYHPQDTTGCPVVVWFHGGGLTQGAKEIPEQLKASKRVIVGVNYRLLPHTDIAGCIDDAAAAVAWVFREIGRYGGDPRKVFVAGHSAGGYLTAMIGLEKKWLAAHGADADSIVGLIPFSGQMISHFAYREAKGMGNLQPLIDAYAPLFHVRPDAPPLVLITGGRDIELLGRYEENAYMWRMMLLTGHTQTYLYEIDGYDHGAMAAPAFHILNLHMDALLKAAEQSELHR